MWFFDICNGISTSNNILFCIWNYNSRSPSHGQSVPVLASHWPARVTWPQHSALIGHLVAILLNISLILQQNEKLRNILTDTESSNYFWRHSGQDNLRPWLTTKLNKSGSREPFFLLKRHKMELQINKDHSNFVDHDHTHQYLICQMHLSPAQKICQLVSGEVNNYFKFISWNFDYFKLMD